MSARHLSDPAQGPDRDRATLLGLAVVLLALAGVCALLGGHLLLGALRLAAGVLAGLGLGAALLALLPGRLAPRPRLLGAAAAALAAALLLTVPAVLSTRGAPLQDHAVLALDALGEGDAVHSLPLPGSPVLVHRASGEAQVLIGGAVHPLAASSHDVLALSADGTRLLRATGASTEVLLLDPTLSTPDGGLPSRTFDGSPVSLADDVLVMRSCEEGLCRHSGFDLAAPEEPLWVVSAPAQTRGQDPAGVPVPARAEEETGLLDALRASGVVPVLPLSFDPAQGWVQLDPATGFPVGRLLAGPDEECRIAVINEPVGGPVAGADPRQEEPLVLTACSAEDGALTASAFRDGTRLWESAPSTAGTWSVRMDGGRVLAAGTGADGAEGELVATEQRAGWTAPGGEGLAQAAALTARVGIDGTGMVVTNEAGQLLAYELADGANTWTLPLSSAGAAVRGTLDAGTAVVLDEARRDHPLAPRTAQRLRVIEASTGEVTVEVEVAGEIGALHPLGGGRALVTVGEQTLLLGA